MRSRARRRRPLYPVAYCRFQDELHPTIIQGWRHVEVKIGDKWVHLRAIGQGNARWAKVKKADALRRYPQIAEAV